MFAGVGGDEEAGEGEDGCDDFAGDGMALDGGFERVLVREVCEEQAVHGLHGECFYPGQIGKSTV